ncbi:MAG: sulfurtransferase [Rhodospirillales bacterium]|nr:sulfurtransferase [Rhodospirillales bacterium]
MPSQIEPEAVIALQESGEKVTVLDVRELWEVAICAIKESLSLPLGALPQNLDSLPKDEPLVVLCHHGMRSMQAVAWLRANGYNNATNMRGGIDAWARRIDSAMPTY